MTEMDREKQLHGLAALATKRSRMLGEQSRRRIGGDRRPPQVQRFSRMKLHAQAGGFGGGMAKAVIAHGAQAPGQHVSHIAPDKFYPRQSQRLATVLMGTVFPTKGDGLVGDGE